MNPRGDWLRFARVGSALAFGFMAGSLQAFTRDAQGMRFDIGVWTAVAFVIGAAVGWLYWRAVMKLSTPEQASRAAKRRFITFSVLLFASAFAAYLYRIRFVSGPGSREVATGAILAFVVVGVIGLVMWRIGRYLEGR